MHQGAMHTDVCDRPIKGNYSFGSRRSGLPLRLPFLRPTTPYSTRHTLPRYEILVILTPVAWRQTKQNNTPSSSSECEFERNYLRAEIDSNKKLVFERALLIAGAGFAATLFPENAEGSELLGFPIIGALAFNLWFTVNRLKSNSRIIAYIQLFHESKTDHCWIGWENALRQYRIWDSNCKDEKHAAEERFKQIKQYDNLSFYNAILAFHLSMAAAVAGLMCYRAWALKSDIVSWTLKSDIVSEEVGIIVFCGIYLVTVIVFFLWARLEFSPDEVKDAIEKNRIRWAAVIDSYTNGELRNIAESEQANLSDSNLP